MKKRNCRLTPIDRARHETAVKIRKMTDEQICDRLYEIRSAGYEAGYKEGRCNQDIIKEFLCRLSCTAGTGTGIGQATVTKIKKFAQEEGYLGL